MTEQTAVDRWVASFASLDMLAAEYARLSREKHWGQLFPTLNLAIVDRWSESELQYIKERAWKIAGVRAGE